MKIKLLVGTVITIFIWQISKLCNLEKTFSTHEAEEQKSQPILITVYYEALCPDSRSFIIKQLLPTFDSIKEYIEIKLIPYGKAETIVINNDYTFNCQHGQIECEANIIHACSINKVQDSKKQLNLVACMIRNNIHPFSILNNCASEMSEYEAILNCSQSIEGRKLLMKYGELTKNLRPRITFIPTITLNNEIDNQILILKNLLQQVCLRIKNPPKQCGN